MKKYFLRSLGSWLLILSLLVTNGSEAHGFQVANGQGILVLVLRLPQGYEFISNAPFSIEIASAAPEVVTFSAPLPGHFDPQAGYTKIPFSSRSGTSLVTIKAKLFYCDKNEKICRQNTHETRLTFEIAPKGSSTLFYVWDIVPKAD